MKNNSIITIDVEGWAQSTLDPNIPITSIAEKNTYYVLDLFQELGIKATMFILGKYAKKFPASVKRIQKDGHEIASHGFGHINVFEQTPDKFKEDITSAKKLLEDLTGVEVKGHRAPAFSILKKNIWALNVIAESGYLYDSSIYPIKHPRYGIEDFPISPVKIQLNDSLELYEFPISAYNFKGKLLPVAGGGYHRLLPSKIIQLVTKNILSSRDFIYYCHPYEFNGNEFNSNEFKNLNLNISTYTKIHQGLGRGRIFENRFRHFVKKFPPQKTMIKALESREQWETIKI